MGVEKLPINDKVIEFASGILNGKNAVPILLCFIIALSTYMVHNKLDGVDTQLSSLGKTNAELAKEVEYFRQEQKESSSELKDISSSINQLGIRVLSVEIKTDLHSQQIEELKHKEKG